MIHEVKLQFCPFVFVKIDKYIGSVCHFTFVDKYGILKGILGLILMVSLQPCINVEKCSAVVDTFSAEWG